MNQDHLNTIRVAYGRYCHPSIDDLPDGWYRIISQFLIEIYDLGDLNDSVSVRFERGPDGLRAFVFPEMSRWHPKQTNALRIAQRELYGLSQQTCEVCGLPAEIGGREIRCVEHSTADPKVAMVDALYQEVRDLFPEVHGSAIDLVLPDHLFDLLASTLRSILKLVRSEDIVGKVVITRVEIDDGALFVRVRYNDLTAVFMGVQMSINEMISDLEVLSDEATRKHGGSNAS